MINRQAAMLVLLLGTFYGSTLVVSRFSVGQYDPRVYISLRLMLAALAHALVYAFSRTRRWPTDPSLWVRAGILGVLGTALPMTAIVSSLQYQSSGVTSLLLTLNPAVVVILAQIFLADEPMTWRRIAGVLIAFGGAGLLLMRGETGLANLVQADWRGYAWVSVGILGGASATVYARRMLRFEDAIDVAAVRMTVAALVLIPVTSLTVGYDLSRVDAAGVMALIYAAIFGTFSGMILNFYIIKHHGATPASQVSYVIPVVATGLGALLLGEQITPLMLVGMVIIFAGITLLNLRSSRQRPTQVE
ncbi:MAG: DMT family transporter [Caldilineaceae bacterium]|nr:DMT family transporter [Caldilineaceae bacterium]MBP8109872.1 DMT family transporter [Caldilineaceae bacterium]MBP8122502.1 DMT family transporter [Caldilineaceae bacterium]MBP9072955.1 DMT family transporter [Caldilineaceae bacterium]